MPVVLRLERPPVARPPVLEAAARAALAVCDAEARALLPGPVDAVPRVVARLQIGGTDLPGDDPGPVRPGRAAPTARARRWRHG